MAGDVFKWLKYFFFLEGSFIMHFIYNLLKFIADDFSIISFWFWVCLAAFAIVYYTLGKKLRFQWILLLLTSLFFYRANNSAKLMLWMLAPICANYLAALVINKLRGLGRTIIVFCVVAANIAFLVYFKEQNFFVTAHNVLAPLFHKGRWDTVNIAAPLGVSYLILMLISYILDVSWGSVKAQKNPLKFLLYVLYFPITTSGPITRYSEVENQLFTVHAFDYDKFCFGVQRIAWGFFKKLVIAERIGLIVNTIYGNWENYQGFTLAIGLLLYAALVYADFSGCIDMVLGASQILGITLPENFRQPFFSTSLSEIWRRWHMTLGFWVKDYVLYPVLKSKPMQNLSAFLKSRLGKKNRYAKLIPTWCGMFCVWFTVGLWHGGSWKYLFGVGLFFFIMIAGGQLLEPVFSWLIKILKINKQTASWRFFQRMRTFFLFAAAVSFQRASSFITGLRMWKRVFNEFNPWIFVDGTLFKIGLDAKDFFVLLFGLMIVLFVELGEHGNKAESISMRQRIANQNIVFRWAVYLGLVFSVIIFGMYGPDYNANSFIYAGF